MKKMIAFLLALALTASMAACTAEETAKAPAQPEATTPTTAETTIPEVIPEETEPAQVPESIPEETVPSEEPPAETPEAEPTTPEVTPPTTTTPSTGSTTKPSTGTTTKPSTGTTSKPSSGGTTASGQPKSISTCKDTGSNEVWYNPKAAMMQDYYQESDPERKDYLEYLKREGNCFFYWLVEDSGMRMYVGRTYGMPLYTSYELMLATTWKSSDPTVATVNEYGFVTPLKSGNTVISATFIGEEGEENIRTTPVRVDYEFGRTFAELEALAKEEAKEIADYVRNELQWSSDLELIAAAAAVINLNYVGKGSSGTYYDIVDGDLVSKYVPGYNQPFGTLVTKCSTCAGDVRALGMVLEYLGFEWYHVNENKNEHQWLVVYDVDGQTAFADGSMFGVAGYGQRQEDCSNWMIYRYGAIQPYLR